VLQVDLGAVQVGLLLVGEGGDLELRDRIARLADDGAGGVAQRIIRPRVTPGAVGWLRKM
jgi:hypothetical protein